MRYNRVNISESEGECVMERLKFAAPCLFGVEGICADELKRCGIENVAAEKYRKNVNDCYFMGSFSCGFEAWGFAPGYRTNSFNQRLLKFCCGLFLLQIH